MTKLFERRHFEWLAQTLKSMPDGEAKIATVRHFIRELRSTNPNFNEDRFWQAAKIKNED